MGEARVGISGWRYPPWRGTFYPKDLPQRRELEFAARHFNSIELNGSFYSLQRPEYYRQWRDDTPKGFTFSIKGGRFITHLLRLKNIEVALSNFFASGILTLNEKIGPILWQFPPNMRFNEGRFDQFFELLPQNTESAVELARGHDRQFRGRVWLKTDRRRPIRHAVEIRHESFRDDAFTKLLRRHNIALVFADTAGKWPYMEDVTSDFVYARLHGEKELYVSGYDDASLDRWADRFKQWRAGGEPADAVRVGGAAKPRKSGRDVYVYFDNDVKVRAPFDAMALARRLGLKSEDLRLSDEVAATITETPRTNWAAFRSKRKSRAR